MVNVVTYCRVSSEEQAQKDISIPAQRKLLNRWVEERPDHRVVAEFVDEGQSAYAPADKRPGFIAMVSHCRKHRIDAILVHKLDRFSRNREESILFKSLLRKHGVAIRSITENFDPETPQGFLYEGMIEVINQFYSMNLATETIKGMRENAERGHVNGGRIPFGYRVEKVTDKNGREHGVLAFSNEQDVAVVREIFDLATTGGMGCKAIANALNARGAAAPRGRHWSGATIDHILNNRVYVGDSVWFKSRKQGRSGRQRTAQDERIVVPDAHPAIIDQETFDRRKALAAERRFDVHTSPGHKVHYLLSRLIVCDVCGNHFGGRRLLQKEKDGSTTERFAYYCGGYLNKGTSVCASLPIPKHWLEGVVLKLLRARLCEPEALAELEEKVRKRIDGIRREYGSDSRVLDQKLADLERRIQNYYAAIGDGLDPAVCRAKIAELTAKKEELEREVALVQREDFLRKALERNLAEVRRFSAVFEDQFESLPFERKRQVVLHFVEKIEVVERRLIRITFQVPFDNTGLKHLVDDIVTPGADTAETETVKMPTIPDGSDSRKGGVRGAISFLTDTRTQRSTAEVLSTWVVSLELPSGPGLRKARPSTLALRRARRGVAVRVAPGTENPVVRFGRRALVLDAESRHGKFRLPGGSPRIATRETESGHGIAPRRVDPWAERLKRTLASLDRARRLRAWIDAEAGRKASDAARHEGVTRARVCQLLSLLKLVPEIRADLERPGRTGKVLGELELRDLAAMERSVQNARYRAMLGLDEPVDERADRRAAKTKARNRGLACHLARARELQALIDTGRFGSIADLARYAGMSGARATQLLNLLGLHPEILAEVDSDGLSVVSERDLRELTRLRNPSEQLAAWRKRADPQLA